MTQATSSDPSNQPPVASTGVVGSTDFSGFCLNDNDFTSIKTIVDQTFRDAGRDVLLDVIST